MKNTLTTRQEKVLAYIKEALERNGFPPTIREIAKRLRLRGPKGIQKHLAALEAKGYIRRRSGLSRAIEVIGWSGADAQTIALPVVGRVRAGAPLLAVEEVEGHLKLDRSLAPSGSLVLKVTGDSMIEAGIHEGDFAVVKPQSRVNQGDIVVALIGEEATVKRFFRESGAIRLEPANARMKPIVIKPGEEEVWIIGKVVAVIRKL
jgi:repressor LexA